MACERQKSWIQGSHRQQPKVVKRSLTSLAGKLVDEKVAAGVDKAQIQLCVATSKFRVLETSSTPVTCRYYDMALFYLSGFNIRGRFFAEGGFELRLADRRSARCGRMTVPHCFTYPKLRHANSGFTSRTLSAYKNRTFKYI